jgi:hypothetical protein
VDDEPIRSLGSGSVVDDRGASVERLDGCGDGVEPRSSKRRTDTGQPLDDRRSGQERPDDHDRMRSPER